MAGGEGGVGPKRDRELALRRRGLPATLAPLLATTFLVDRRAALARPLPRKRSLVRHVRGQPVTACPPIPVPLASSRERKQRKRGVR